MSARMTWTVQPIEKKAAPGDSVEDQVAALHEQGLSIIESIKVLMETRGVTLGEAKSIVVRHPVWATVVPGADMMHGYIIKILKKESAGTIGVRATGAARRGATVARRAKQTRKRARTRV